jgi:murein DD-endopeptidase MepM/ murein hydrolase activator NlpD
VATKPLVWDVWPVEELIITTRFGEDGHRGLDLAPWNAPAPHIIYAPAPGVVVDFLNSWDSEYNSPTFGIGVCIDHVDTPEYSLYAHLERAYVEVGDTVASGQAIGEMGWTGKVLPKGPGGKHLHWQVCKSKNFPIDISQSSDPLSFPFSYNTPPAPVETAGGLSEARVRAIVEGILDARGLSKNFAPAVSRRLALISDATDLHNPDFNS